MCKRIFLLASSVLLFVCAPSFADDSLVIFEDAIDVHPINDTINLYPDITGAVSMGSTVFQGIGVGSEGELVEQYLITGYGADIWGKSDEFHYAYRTMTGGVRLSAEFEWVDPGPNSWAKYGVMLRASDHTQSPNYVVVSRPDESLAQLQRRTVANNNSSSQKYNASDSGGAERPLKLGIQRVVVDGFPFVEGLVDWGLGNGWERVGSLRMPAEVMGALPDQMMVGVAVTSHTVWDTAQALAKDVTYQLDPQFVGPAPEFPTVMAASVLEGPMTDTPGFHIRALKPIVTQGWGADGMNELLDTGMYMGAPALPGSEGTRVSPFVNLYDTGGRDAFNEGNGYPDETFPGIDPFESPADSPAAGDDDNQFAVEVLACIHLTEGLHLIGILAARWSPLSLPGMVVTAMTSSLKSRPKVGTHCRFASSRAVVEPTWSFTRSFRTAPASCWVT